MGRHKPAHFATAEVEVRYAETDQMGVVHHANYLIWFELARTRLCMEAGFHYSQIEKEGYLLLVTGAQLSYRAPARYGDRVLVHSWVDRLSSRGVTFSYCVEREQQVLATGSTEHVWVDAATRRPIRFPEAFYPPFSRFLPFPPSGGS